MRVPFTRTVIPIAFLFIALIIGFSVSENSQAQEFGSNWVASFYNSTDFTGAPFTIPVAQVNANYGAGAPPEAAGAVGADNFSIRFSSINAFAAGTYRFFARADDGVRVTVGGTPVIDFLGNRGGEQTQTADVFVADGNSEVIVEYVEAEGQALVQVYWQAIETVPTATAGPSPTPTATGLPPIPPGALTGTVIRAGVLNVRAAPSLGAPVIGRTLRGQTYAIVGRDPNARWFLLQLAGKTGWAYGYYLFIDGNEFNPPISSSAGTLGLPPGLPDTGVIVQVRAGMKLRGEPNVQSRQTGRITWGSFLPVTGRTSAGDWYQVVWKGTVGWMFSGYARVFQGDFNNVPVVPGY